MLMATGKRKAVSLATGCALLTLWSTIVQTMKTSPSRFSDPFRSQWSETTEFDEDVKCAA